MDKSKYGVHQTHCCVLHGCKYGDSDCPVVNEEIEQKYTCESCDMDGIETVKEVLKRHKQSNVWNTLEKDKYNEKGIKDIEDLNTAINRIIRAVDEKDIEILYNAISGSLHHETMDILSEYLNNQEMEKIKLTQIHSFKANS